VSGTPIGSACVPWSDVGDFLLGGGVAPLDPKVYKLVFVTHSFKCKIKQNSLRACCYFQI